VKLVSEKIFLATAVMGASSLFWPWCVCASCITRTGHPCWEVHIWSNACQNLFDCKSRNPQTASVYWNVWKYLCRSTLKTVATPQKLQDAYLTEHIHPQVAWCSRLIFQLFSGLNYSELVQSHIRIPSKTLLNDIIHRFRYIHIHDWQTASCKILQCRDSL